MIGTLVLDEFGAFTDRSFDLAPVTVFLGPNEAGKSTIFDALAFALCGPIGLKGNKRAQRYGKGVRARALKEDGSELEDKLDANEYFNLLAIRADSLEVPISGDGVWVATVKNRLFSGGANPELIARDLEKALRDGKRADAALEAALREANGRVEDVRSRLSAIERAKEGLATEAAALAQLEAEAQRLEAERDAAARERDRAAAATRYREDRGILADMESLEALRSRPASKDETQALRSLKEEASRAAAAFAEAKTAEQLARRAHAALSERRSRAEAALAAAEPGARLARDLAGLLERENVIRERRIRRPGLASILSIVLFPLAGAAGFMFAALGALPFATSLIFPSAGIVLGLLGFLLGMKKEVLQDDSRPRLALERAAAEWTTRMGREGGPPSDSPALALAWFRSAAAEGDRLAREAAGLEAELRAGEAGLAALARAREDAQAAVLSANAALGSWLAARGAADPEAYLAAQASAVERERQAEQVRERVQAAMSARGCSRPEELQAELRREMASLESVHGALASEAPRPQAEARAAAAAAAYDDCRSRLEAARLKAKTDQAVAGRDESGLLDELSRAEEAVAAARERMDAAALERASDAAALEVFRFLASSGAASFAALSSTTASYYQRAVDRPVALSFDSLDLEKALVPDSGGIGRPPEFLSLGTRDCFVLACRLALAQSILPAGGVLVFDEPFKNLDAHRSLRAMEMIRDYRAARGAQLFFFTKESSLADAARSLFPSGELRVYDLASPGKAGADAVVP